MTTFLAVAWSAAGILTLVALAVMWDGATRTDRDDHR